VDKLNTDTTARDARGFVSLLFTLRHKRSRRENAKLSLALRASELLFGIAQKVAKKARHRTRWFDSHRANRTSLRFSPAPGCSDSTSMYCFASAAIHRRAPSG